MGLMKEKVNNIAYAIPAVMIFSALFFIRGIPFEDDAYIFYRYAENWASGNGPVFNIGENVEGYSSFLWQVILTLGAYFSLPPEKFAPFLNLAIGIICIFFVGYIREPLFFSKPRLAAFTLPLFYALSYGFYYYAANGMDTIIFSLVLMICILTLYRGKKNGNYIPALISLIMMDLVRAEGFVYSIILILLFAFFVYRDEKRLSRKLLLTLAAFFGTTALLFLLRHSYYNEWMPATVMTKGYGTYLIKQFILEGDFEAFKEFLRVILSGFKYEAFLLLTGAWIPFVLLLLKENRKNFLLWLIAVSITLNIAITVWAGGDYFPYKRHLVVVFPILIIFVAWAVDFLFNKYWKSTFFIKASLSVIAFLLIVSWTIFFIRPKMPEKVFLAGNTHTEYLREVGLALSEIDEPTIMMSQMIGKMSYYAGPDVYVRDILGLTDIHNAKYGDSWSFNLDGKGSCGRTDFDYSFNSPFDLFFYNSTNMHNKFISFCQENPALCEERYRFFRSDKWPDSYFYIIANINHPVSRVLEEKFDAVALSIGMELRVPVKVEIYN